MTLNNPKVRTKKFRPFLNSSLLYFTTILASGIYFGGCFDGGTSSGGGNPDLTLQIKGTKNNAPFQGFIQFFVQGSDPVFFTPPPDDGFTNPKVSLGGEDVSTLFLQPSNTIRLNRSFLWDLLNANPMQPLFKGSETVTAKKTLPPFNIILMGADSTAGLLQGIRLDTLTGKLRYADGSGGDTLFISLDFGTEYAGALDTTNLSSAPLGLYVPGTPYYAQVHGDSFHFSDMPSGKLPLRLITADGWIRNISDSLGEKFTGKIKPGPRLDSLNLPAPNPVLAPPVPSPLGHYAFTDSVSITLKAESGAIIYYTLDGTTPNQNSKRYTNPLILYASATLKSIAFKKGCNRSPISYNNYQLVPAPPIANPASWVFHDSVRVSLKTKNPNDEIFYTVDGSMPTKLSNKYTSPLKLSRTTELKAITYSLGLGTSRITEEKYILVSEEPLSIAK